MNPPYNNVFRKVENAFATYLTAQLSAGQLAGAAIHLGIANEMKTVPYIYCHCPEGREDEPGTGNYHVEAEIGVVANANDETALADAERFSNVLDVIHRDTLKASLSAAESSFSVIGISQMTASSGLDGAQWKGTIRVPMLVAGSAL